MIKSADSSDKVLNQNSDFHKKELREEGDRRSRLSNPHFRQYFESHFRLSIHSSLIQFYIET